MHRAWLRPAMFAAIEDAAREALAPAAPAAMTTTVGNILQPGLGARERTTLNA